MAQTLSNPPQYVVAGDSIAWTVSLPDYPASAGWVLSYTLINASAKVSVTATASGDDFAVSVSAATSASWVAGDYTIQGAVSLSGARYTVSTGTIKIKPNLAAQAGGYEARSTAQKALDDLRAALVVWMASNGQVSEYEIAGRRMKYASSADIQARIQMLEREVAREAAAERIASGLSSGRRVFVRF